MVGFGSVGFKRNTKTLVRLTDPEHVFNALQTPDAAFELGADVRLPRHAFAARGVYAKGNGFRLTCAEKRILSLGDYGRPATAVTDIAIVGFKIGPAPAPSGSQTGDGIAVYAGSTRFWFDGLVFEGPYGDEAFSLLHHPNEPKSQMWGTLSNCRYQNMMRSLGGSEYAVLLGDGSYPNSEVGPWASTARREPPNALTIHKTHMENVWWRCPLVYHGWLHYKDSTVKSINHSPGENIDAAACMIYGASEAIIEGCTFDRGTSASKAAAIQAEPKDGHHPRVTERNNTFIGNYPWGKVLLNGAQPAQLTLPYTL